MQNHNSTTRVKNEDLIRQLQDQNKNLILANRYLRSKARGTFLLFALTFVGLAISLLAHIS